MRKIFLLLFCLIGLAASAQQTRPTTPVQKAQNSAYLDTSTGIRWYFDGVNWFAIPPYSPPNTLLTGLSMTVASSTLTVHTGTWRIGNVVYTLGSNTNFTLKPRDTITHYYRYEAVYAIKANNGIGLKVDSLTPSPIQHQFGTDTLTVGYVLVTPTGYQVVPPIPTNQFVFSNIGVGSPVQQVGSYPWVTSLKADTIKVGGHYILPPIDGTSGQVIQTDGAGNLFWSNQAIYLPLYPITISANNIGVDTAGSTRGLVTHTALMDTLTKNAAHFDNSFTISNDTIHLATTGVSPGSYTSTNLTVNSKGQITAASNGSGASYTATGGVVLSGTSFRLGSGTLQGGTVAISSPTTTNFSMSSNSGGNTVGMQMFSGVLQLTSHKSGNGTAFMQFTNPSDAETKMGYQNSTATTEKSLTFGIANKGVLWTDNVDTLGGQFASDYSVKQRLQRLSIPSVGTAIQIADSVVLAHPGTTYTASNGLNLSGTQFKLGGTLTGATSIAQTSTNKLTFTGYDIIVNNARVGIGGGNLPSNAALGAGAMTATNTGGQNTAVGSIALNSATTASDNTGLGWSALSLCVGCTTSVAVGSGAGLQNASGVGNVFLGYNAGSAELGSNKLYISNSSTTTPLIKGDFSAETVQVYGTLGSWTPAGTPGTDSVMVKHGNSYYAISPTYYGTGAGSGTVTSITPGVGFLSHTPITTSGTMDVDTASTIVTKTFAGRYIKLNSLSATSPIFYNNTTGVISSQAASASQNGYLTSTDWSTFNGKGAGTVTSVTSANADIAVATTTTTPVLTLNSGSTANKISKLDGNANITANNLLPGYQTIATAAGTTTLTVASPSQSYFTGTTTQTVVLPVTSTLVLGQQFTIANNSTGLVTVQSSGANSITTVPTGVSLVFTCILTSGTTATSWSVSNQGVFASGIFSGSGTPASPYALIIDSAPTNGSSNPVTSGGVYTALSSISPAGSNKYVQFNNSGVLGAVADFTFDFSLPQLYVKGKNFQSMILNAPTYSTLELQSNGTATGYLGSGKSSNLTAATDVSLIGNSNVSVEGTNVYIYGNLRLPNSGQLGTLSQAYINYSTSSSLGSIMQWNFATSHTGQVGNAGLMISSPNNANDFAMLTSTDNLEFITGGTTQTNVSGQIFKTTGNWVFQRGGTFTDNGSTVQTQSLSMAINATAKTTTYTATATDHTIRADGTSAAFTVTLPTAVGCQGREYTIKKTDSSVNAITVGTTSSQTIDGSTTYSLSLQYKYVTVQSNNVSWDIIANN